MNVLDLFSGIGGFSLGLERAGMRTVAFCEIDAFCRKVLAKNFPGRSIYNDVRTLTGDRLRADGIAVDLICGGFPCQDISTAGKGAGIKGERSGLWSEYARIIGEVRPRYVIVENVAALLGRGLSRVLGDLAALGFDAEWHCIPASAIGAPHRRDRMWIVADAAINGNRKSEQNLSELDKRDLCGWPQMPADVDGRYHARTMANAEHWQELDRTWQARRPTEEWETERREPRCNGEAVAHANGGHKHGRIGSLQMGWGTFAREIADNGEFGRTQWGAEPDVGRVAYGVPARVDRLCALGNAVVPQIPEIIGRAIMRAG